MVGEFHIIPSQKLETIIETGISFSEINKNEYLLQSALEQDGGITFIKYLLDRGASLVKLQQLHDESLINYVIKNTHTINSSVLTLLMPMASNSRYAIVPVAS